MRQLIRILMLTAIVFLSAFVSFSQSAVTLGGGYSFTNLEDVAQNTTGWRLNFTYEYYQTDNWIWGFSAGYAQTKGIADEGQINETEFKAGHWPIYVSPKYMFFDMDSFRPFFKGMLGIHFSDYDRKGPLGTLDSGDSGFYGGLGAGVSKKVGESIILNVEYEWAYLSNSWYKDGFFNSLMFSVGYSFY